MLHNYNGVQNSSFRGSIEKVDNIVPVTASSSLALSQDRKIVIWTLGMNCT